MCNDCCLPKTVCRASSPWLPARHPDWQMTPGLQCLLLLLCINAAVKHFDPAQDGQPDQQPTLMASRGSLSASIMASAYSSLAAAPKPAKVRSPLMSRVTSTSRVGALTFCTPSRSTPLPAPHGRAPSDLGEPGLPARPAMPLPAPHHRVSSGSGTCSKQTVTAEQSCVRSRDMLLHARLPSRQTSHAEASQHQASGHGRSCIIHSGSAEQLIVQLSPCVEQEPQPGSHLTGSRAALTSTVMHQAPTQLLGEQLDHMEQSQSLRLTSSSSAPQAVHTFKAARFKALSLQVRPDPQPACRQLSPDHHPPCQHRGAAICPTLAPAQQRLTLQELNHLPPQVVLPNGRQETDVDLQAAQCCHHIGGGAAWVGCPGLHLLQGHALLVGQAVCMAIMVTDRQSRLRSGWTGRACRAAAQSGPKAGSVERAREQAGWWWDTWVRAYLLSGATSLQQQGVVRERERRLDR